MLYKAKVNEDEGIFKGVKVIGNDIPIGYELVETYFVDNSGFGAMDEPALQAGAFLKKVKAGYYYGITETGQFQIYIAKFRKSIQSRKALFEAQGITRSRIIKNNTRLTEYKNGDKVLRLHSTDIITWKGDKIILNSGGWDTMTTRSRFNEFLPDGLQVFRAKGMTFINDSRFNKSIQYEFTDGIELPL